MPVIMTALEQHRAERPSQVALSEGPSRLHYGALPDAVAARRQRLIEHQVAVLAIELDNGIEWVLWDLAAVTAKVVCVPIPPFFSAPQRRHAYASAGVDAAITPRGLERFQHPAVTVPRGTAKITFTSGTTGTSKGVCLSLDGLERVAASVFEAIDGSRYNRHFSAMPLAVLLENVAGVYTALIAGCRIEVPARSAWMDAVALLSDLAESRAQTVILVPELLRGLIELMHRTPQSIPDLEFLAVGGARLSPGLVQRARALGLPVYEGYGLSECGSVVSLNTPSRDRPGTVGRVLPHVDLRVEDGEIVVANPVYLGYLGMEPTRVLRTGDLGERDSQGFLSVKGRSKHVLITSYGRNISPEWLEAELLSQPEISQVVACGDGWPHPGALIVANADDSSVMRAVAAANASLPDYARIAGWLRVPAFSRTNGFLTGTGRVCRHRVIEQYLGELESRMSQAEFYDRLVDATARAREELYAVPQLRDGLNGRISCSSYVAYLTEAYHHVRHTVPFLMAMGSRLPAGMEWIQQVVVDYINEEKGHENWILCDIKAAGGDPDEAARAIPNLETQVLVAYNYDYIQRKNPLGFLGMVFMLESTSMRIATRGASSIQGSLDLPDDAFTYLHSHGKLDQEHMRLFRGLVNGIKSASDQAAIIEVACNTFRLFADVLRSIPHGEVQSVA